MKKILMTVASAAMLLTTSCDSKLEFTPYGDSTLSTVDELETLLNGVPQLWCGDDYFDLDVLCNNNYRPWQGVNTYAQTNNNSLTYAYFTYNEDIDRADLSDSDYRYTTLYEWINYANVVASKVPDADGGTAAKKEQLVAEARVKRAWFHFLLAGIHAKQYDEATAASLGGVPYVDNTDVSVEKTKLTLKETYEHILNDCSDEVISKLIQANVPNVCRFGADFGYGVRARVLFQMKRYDEALKYAELALKINSRLIDRSDIKTSGNWIQDQRDQNNYYIIYESNSNLGEMNGYVISPDVVACIDPNDYVMKYVFTTDGHFGWDTPYPTVPDGCLQCQCGDAYVNKWGLRTESMLYLAGECQIRLGQIKEGLARIDKVRATRIENPEVYAEKNGLNEAQAMKLLQDSKRIEFINTFENFFDRKRWNSEENYKETIVRDMTSCGLGKHSITPESPLWVFPFPMEATKYNKSLTQNY
ncbi:MAG: RagB/SusD family nutrient uptake outer membrane protein [Muribaculaceae bacterium]|nr:RagB/SusD family nutrient uptake outer membrane protein [Muribaculaceae bacterium]